jgi:hypothetical protein
VTPAARATITIFFIDNTLNKGEINFVPLPLPSFHL